MMCRGVLVELIDLKSETRVQGFGFVVKNPMAIKFVEQRAFFGHLFASFKPKCVPIVLLEVDFDEKIQLMEPFSYFQLLS